MTSNAFKKVLKEKGITMFQTLKHAAYAESFIRTLKMMIHNLVTGADLGPDKWINVLTLTLGKYNSTPRSTTGLSPIDAKSPEDRDIVVQNNLLASKNNHHYPALTPHESFVRVLLKSERGVKATPDKWTKEKYMALGAVGNLYEVAYNKHYYLRSELLRV